jgi:hypothetical protein
MIKSKNVYKYLTLLIPVLIFVFSCNNDSFHKKGRLEVDSTINIVLYDSDFSQALTKIYQLNNDSIRVSIKSGIAGEGDKVIYKRSLSIREKDRIMTFFMKFPLSSLESKYSDPNIDDGDQKVFIVKIGDLEKRILVSNYDQPELMDIVELLKSLIDEKNIH